MQLPNRFLWGSILFSLFMGILLAPVFGANAKQTMPDHVPGVKPQKLYTSMGTPLVIQLSGTDAENHSLKFEIWTRPMHGKLVDLTLLDRSTATVTYVPEPGFKGFDRFTYVAGDGQWTSRPAPIVIRVLGPGEDPMTPPVSDDQSAGITSSKTIEPNAFNATTWYVQTEIGVGTDDTSLIDDLTVMKPSPDILIRGTGTTCSGSGDCPTLWFGNSSTPVGAAIYSIYNSSNEFDLYFRTNFVDRMIIDKDGNVGISTTTPSQPLTMGGTIGWEDGTSSMLMLGEGCCDANSRMIFAHSPLFPQWGIFYDDPEDIMHWQINSALRVFTVDFSGQIGINNEAPASELDLQPRSSSASPQIAIRADAANAGHFPNIRFYNNTTGVGQFIADVNTGRMVFDFDGSLSGSNFAVRKRLNSDADIAFFINSDGSVAFNGTTMQPGAQVTVNGNLHVNGNITKTGAGEIVVIPEEDREIHYSVSIGPEIGTYVRGTERLKNGQVVIHLPDHFRKVTESDGLTVTLTPVGGWHRLYVVEKTVDYIIVRDADGCDNVTFDYLVQGIRKGMKDFKVIQ